MRTALVVTNRRCNQNCRFCTERSAEDDRASIHRDAVMRRIARAADEGAEQIVLTGGEPTLRGDLAALVAFARNRAEVVLETNGSMLDAASVDALIGAGVSVFRLHVPAMGRELVELTRDDDAAASLTTALSLLNRSTAALEIATPLVRSNLASVESLPAAIVDAAPRARLMLVSMPTSSPDPRELISFAEAGQALVALDAAGRRVGLPIKIAAGSGPPPCIVARRPAHLWSLTGTAPARDDRIHVEACEACRVRPQCSGLDAATVRRFGLPEIEPIADERARRRLTLIASVEEQVQREFITRDRARDPAGGAIDEEIIRVQFQCNQSCGFCFVSTHLPAPDHTAVLDAIDAAISRGAKVVLSGGEPTLTPRLAEYVRRGSRGGALALQLQTNAIRLDDETLVQDLVDAGLREAFVSLHGADAAISDRVTGAPRTFVRTVAGIDNLYRAGVLVITNFVLCTDNAADFPRYVDLVAERWPRSVINVSFVAPSTDVVPRELVPRLSDVIPALIAGLTRARELGIEVRGFESMCGIPLCLLPAPFDQTAFVDVASGMDRGEFIHSEACSSCSAKSRCYGLRRGYAELHGVEELRPIA